jgi:hypothetical protein
MTLKELRKLKKEMSGDRMFLVFTPNIRNDCVDTSEERLADLLEGEGSKSFLPGSVTVKEIHSI